MSHFSKIKAEIRDEECLLKALEDLGYPYQRDATIRGFGGQSMRVDVAVPQEGGYDIGFLREGEEFQMVADLWGLKVNKEEFLQRVQQRHAYHVVLKQAQTQGFTVVEEQECEDGSIRLVCEREEEAEEVKQVEVAKVS